MIITVYGTPAPMGSKSGFYHKATGRVILAESSKKVKPWRQAVYHAAQAELVKLDDPKPIAGPVILRVTFYLERPKNPKFKHWPAVAPDLSKLVRSTEDALTDAGVWEDDSRVVECYAEKAYVSSCIAALTSPGCVIEVQSAARFG